MRINVYTQELTDEVALVSREDPVSGEIYRAARLFLHSSELLHRGSREEEDDRSAITFWVPSSPHRRAQFADAFFRIADIFRTGGLS